MAGTIGIKQANGNFYSILEENSTAKKRLVLTTVHDNQNSVQIDLYKSTEKTMADALYIGSIVVENISPKQKGEPSIEMILSSSPDGSINANAADMGNPSNEHHLSVSLKSFEDDKSDYPDFEMEDKKTEKTNWKFPILAIIIIGLILVMVCLGLWFFLFRNRNARQKPETVAASTVITKPAEAPATVQPDPVADPPAPQQPAAPAEPKPETVAAQPVPQQPATPEPKPAATTAPVKTETVIVPAPPKPNPQAADRKRPSAPVYSFNVPQNIPPEGITYTVRWGDTLWDISEAFYRNPRLYTFIVRSNEIRNPNLIIPGTELTILPRK